MKAVVVIDKHNTLRGLKDIRNGLHQRRGVDERMTLMIHGQGSVVVGYWQSA